MSSVAARLTAALAERYRWSGRSVRAAWQPSTLRHDRMVAMKVVKPELSALLGPPDGSRIAYISAKFGTPAILTRNSDGSGGAEKIVQSQSSNYTAAWTPDGSRLITVH